MIKRLLIPALFVTLLIGCGGETPDSTPDVVLDGGTDSTPLPDAGADPDVAVDTPSDTVEVGPDLPDAPGPIVIVAEMPERSATVGSSVTVEFLVTQDGAPAGSVTVDITASGGTVADDFSQSDADGIARASVTLDTSLGETSISASSEGGDPTTVRVTRTADSLAAIDGADLRVQDWATQTLEFIASDQYGNPLGAAGFEIELDMSLGDVTLEAGSTTDEYESDGDGRLTLAVTADGFLGPRESGEEVQLATVTQVETDSSVPLIVSLLVSDPPTLIADLPEHYVARPGTDVPVTVQAQTSAGEPMAGLALRLQASGEWPGSEGVTDIEGLAQLTTRAPERGSEAELVLETRGYETRVGLAQAAGPTFEDQGDSLLLEADTLDDFAVASERSAVVVVESTEFSDGFVRPDIYVFEPATGVWTQALPRRELVHPTTGAIHGERILKIQATERVDGEDRALLALIDLRSPSTHTLVDGGPSVVSDRYEPETGRYYFAVNESGGGDGPYRIDRVDLEAAEVTVEEVLIADAPPLLEFGECDGAMYWQNGETFELVRSSGSRNDTFVGVGDDAVQIDVVHAESGRCEAFLHNFASDDTFYQFVPRGDAYYLRRLMIGHDANLLIPSYDLSFIVVDSWVDHIIRTIHLDGEEHVFTELTGEHDLHGFHPTELAPSEDFLLVERHYVNGIEELFYVQLDGRGPDLPMRVSPDIPPGVPGWPLRHWVTSPEFDEVVLLHPVAPSDRERILGAFTVDLSEPEAGSTLIDPTVGPDPYELDEGMYDLGYDPSGRWLFLVGDADTAGEHNFYVRDRARDFFRAVWTETSEAIQAEFLANGDWAAVTSDSGIRLIDVADAMLVE